MIDAYIAVAGGSNLLSQARDVLVRRKIPVSMEPYVLTSFERGGDRLTFRLDDTMTVDVDLRYATLHLEPHAEGLLVGVPRLAAVMLPTTLPWVKRGTGRDPSCKYLIVRRDHGIDFEVGGIAVECGIE